MLNWNSATLKLWAKLGPRSVFGSVAAPELAASNPDVLYLAADVASSAGLSRMKDSMPDRLINMGIAEQNMVGVAAGLAMEGFTPFACSFAPFITARVADQVRLCLGYMNLPVKLVSLASGLAMGINGPSHLGFEDAAIMRAMPGIAIVCPADAAEAVKGTFAAASWPGPLYLRLAADANCPMVYDGDYDFQIGKAIVLKDGKDAVFIANGPMVAASLKAAAILEEKGLQAGVINMHTLRPLDREAILMACDARLIITVEEHGLIGGLGSAVAEVLAQLGNHPPLLRLGLERFPHADTYANLLKTCGLGAEAIADRVLAALEKQA